MPNVTQLAAMYGKPTPSSLPQKPTDIRKKNPVGVSNFSAIKVPPKDDNIPEWKRELQQRKGARLKTQEDKEEANHQSTIGNEKGGCNGRGQNGQSRFPEDSSESGGNQLKQNDVSRRNQANKTATSTTKSNTPSSYVSTLKSEEKKKSDNNSAFQQNIAPVQNLSERTDRNRLPSPSHAKPSAGPEQSTSFIHKAMKPSSTGNSFLMGSSKLGQSDARKAGANSENEFSSGGSRGSQDITSKPSVTDNKVKSNRPSFLHRTAASPTPVNSSPQNGPSGAGGDRRRRPLPPVVFDQPPPEKPRKPFNARLPNQGAISALHIAQQQQSHAVPSLPSRDVGKSPANDSIMPKRGESFLQRQQKTEPSSAPALPRGYPGNLPDPGGRIPKSQFPDRPVPSIPETGSASGSFLPPALPGRPDRSLPLEPPRIPDSSVAQRSLPAVPGERVSVSSQDAPPLPPPNERRKSSQAPLPSTPSATSMQQQEDPEEIPIWNSDEETEEAVYDETPDSFFPSGPPALPSKDFSQLPSAGQEVEENYIDPSTSPVKEKKKIDKREKEMRKKFKLPMEGEIPVQSAGTIKSDSKWFEKFSVHANESVDIIRTNDNPKGKWLIRNKKGLYGYIDSDNIEMDTDALRQIMLAAGGKPTMPVYLPAGETSQEDMIEDVYDAAADEDFYEELG